METVTDAPSSKHKRNPHLYGLPPFNGPRGDAITRGRLSVVDTNAPEPRNPAPVEELRLVFDGEERDLLDVARVANTYHGGVRADLRLGIDADGETTC